MRTFMQNQNNKFERLIGYARSMLDFSFEELKVKYIRYPICLMVYVENRKLEKSIEIRFDNQEATISCAFDQADRCIMTYLFFDSQSDENNFIEYLKTTYDFDFRKNCWHLGNCCLKIRNTKDSFCFYLFL